MASITTILGTDSVSSSRIVINNNFAALNQDLLDLGALLVTTNQTLTLTGLITGGTLDIINSSQFHTFKVNESTAEVNVPATFTQDVILEKALIHSVYYNATTLPIANAYNHTTYVLDATVLTGTNILAAADNGQEITIIANGGTIDISNANIAGVTANVTIGDTGSLTLRYIDDLSLFFIISSVHSTIVY